MFPFWDLAIAPVFDAVGAKRVVEIGALRGETTIRMLDRLGPEAELHVIDPVPEFDPGEHERQFPGRYIFHRDLSVNVLLDLPPMDVALIDGDHNWYTVYHELNMLSEVARKAGEPLPVMILHDVCWPYGRRDLYYAPETIPEEFRQPYERKGIGLGVEKLLPRGGLNPTLCNAIAFGGPRNGVMTGIEDFVDEYDRPLRHVVLPIYFGLSIVVEEERIEKTPELAAVLDHLASTAGKDDLLELAEDTRLRSMVFQHNVYYQSERQMDRAASRYLGLLKGALLDRHYLENEVRLHYLMTANANEQPIEPEKLRDPLREMRMRSDQMLTQRAAGEVGAKRGDMAPAYFPYTTMGQVRLDDLHACLDTVRTESVRGDLVDCGTGRGGAAILMRGYLDAHERKGDVWVADRFLAAPTYPTEPGGLPGGGAGFPDFWPDLNVVRDGFHNFDLLDDRVHFLQGPYETTLADLSSSHIALLRIGPAAADQTAEILDQLYGKLSYGGFVVIDDYRSDATKAAVDEFRARHKIADPLERIDWVGARWRKSPKPDKVRTDADNPAAAKAFERRPAHPPLAPAAPKDRKNQTVVVVFYNMRREAERSLHALSRAYQQEIEDLNYEVIVVENGSEKSQRLGQEFVQSFGPEFHYLDMGDQATPSPVPALNAGIAHGSGDAFALMIDGAHVLTPRVLSWGMAGLRTYKPAIVLTQQWYVGPGQQPAAVANGYDQAAEDALFEAIKWPQDGYALFDIGHFISDRDWFDGMWESNCIFVPRGVLRQAGCFDESFTTPGGGYANLDLYERLGSSPDLQVTTILGEGSFHQVHGGTTTNPTTDEERNLGLVSYAQQYAQLRGRAFSGPGRPLHYVGQMSGRALRTKARRRIASHFWAGPNTPGDPDAYPASRTPIPDELKEGFTDAVWRNLGWKKTQWLGHQVPRLPTDLFLYQELISSIRPDWIIETGSGNGGRANFLASILDLVDHGQILSIDRKVVEDRAVHPRIRYFTGDALDEEIRDEVFRSVGDPPRALVILGSRANAMRTVAEFDTYSPLVPVGSYVVIEETILNGHPAWPSFGPGPMEAVKRIVNRRGEFVSDQTLERLGLTFNALGYLKRMSLPEDGEPS